MTGYCVKGQHKDCPDTKQDTWVCGCPCHLYFTSEDGSLVGKMRDHLEEQRDKN